jgi:hypothetical protein
MVALQDYTTEVYHSLESLHRASELFKDSNAEELLDTKISALFLKYQLQDKFGVALLHRHFDMDSEEKLVENGNVATPWAFHQSNDDLFGGEVVPKSWMYRDQALHPYEFGYNSEFEQTYPGAPDNGEFLEEFGKLLEENRLDGVLGLTAVGPSAPGTMKYEKTFGRSNVVFTMSQGEADAMDKETVSALWLFSAQEPSSKNGYRAMGCRMGCRCFPSKFN